jgi:EAL and modified HD-GYP domain-containing signal transduction protein
MTARTDTPIETKPVTAGPVSARPVNVRPANANPPKSTPVEPTQAGPRPDEALLEPDPKSGMRYVARQPILDLVGKVHGYELLFREGPKAVFSGDGDLATRTMIDNTVLFGLDRLTGNIPIFLNCTEEALTERLVHMLPTSMTVLEILETLDPSPSLVRACQHLKACGFRLALDDFTWKAGIEPLVEIADYIKVDFAISGVQERRELLNRLKGVSVALIAEKVESQEEYQRARDEGFTLMQGYHFCRPQLMGNLRIPANKMLHVEILRMLQKENMDLNELALLVKRDAALTYRLLRLINSPMSAMRQEVQSVHAALMAVGEDGFRRLAFLAITSELNTGHSAELLRMAFVRGRFCELASVFCNLSHAEQYLLGLLSLLPAMLRSSIHDVAPLLPLREQVRRSLMGEDLPERALLSWLEGHEKGDWTACDFIATTHGLRAPDLLVCYEEALHWAEDALHSV